MATKIKGLYQKRGWYYFQPSQKGGVKIKPIALETKDIVTAIECVEKIKASGDYTNVPTRLDTVIQSFLRCKKSEGKRPKTITGYRDNLNLIHG